MKIRRRINNDNNLTECKMLLFLSSWISQRGYKTKNKCQIYYSQTELGSAVKTTKPKIYVFWHRKVYFSFKQDAQCISSRGFAHPGHLGSQLDGGVSISTLTFVTTVVVAFWTLSESFLHNLLGKSSHMALSCLMAVRDVHSYYVSKRRKAVNIWWTTQMTIPTTSNILKWGARPPTKTR